MVKEERGRPRGQVLCSSAWEVRPPRLTARVNPTIDGAMLCIWPWSGVSGVYSRVDPCGQPGAGLKLVYMGGSRPCLTPLRLLFTSDPSAARIPTACEQRA